jgi:tRNA nucleotidyltransferase/poly(A) polymerase
VENLILINPISQLVIPTFFLELAQEANNEGEDFYLVGGSLRDLFLGQSVVDFDFMCGKNAVELAKLLSKNKIARLISVHEEFGTAKIEYQNHNVDLATARKETYSSPGALPKVEYPTKINDDLIRRDFSINAIAARLTYKGIQEIIDPFDGLGDLTRKVIRVLHDESYYEDPTRILRAIRFSERFQFELSQSDKKLISQALQKPELEGLSQKIRGIRFGIELKRMLELPNWMEAVIKFSEIGAWSLIRPNLLINCHQPHLPINFWENRLLWVLWNNPELLSNIVLELGVGSKTAKLESNLRQILRDADNLNLKTLAKLELMNEDQRNLLFSLRPSYKNLFERMKLAKPTITPEELMKKGYKGPDIQIRLEQIFQFNLRNNPDRV